MSLSFSLSPQSPLVTQNYNYEVIKKNEYDSPSDETNLSTNKEEKKIKLYDIKFINTVTSSSCSPFAIQKYQFDHVTKKIEFKPSTHIDDLTTTNKKKPNYNNKVKLYISTMMGMNSCVGKSFVNPDIKIINIIQSVNNLLNKKYKTLQLDASEIIEKKPMPRLFTADRMKTLAAYGIKPNDKLTIYLGK